jgi:hypothetical protein
VQAGQHAPPNRGFGFFYFFYKMFAVRFLWRRTAKGSDCRALVMVAHGKG